MAKILYLSKKIKADLLANCTGKSQDFIECFLDDYSNKNNVSLIRMRRFLQDQGLYKITKYRKWTTEEIDILEDGSGSVPINVIVARVRKLNKARGKSQRTKSAIQEKMRVLGLSEECDGEYLNVRDISRLIGCDRRRVVKWINTAEMQKILKPIVEPEQYRIHRKDFINFVVAFRSEVLLYKDNIDWEWFFCLMLP